MIIKQNLVISSKYSIKCPYAMTPKYVTVHNTDNPNAAPAKSEVDYMISNDNQVSFHVAVDDVEAIQGIPFNRNAWASGDGANGNGNRNSIHVEICKNKLGASSPIFKKAETNAVEVCTQLLKQYGLGIDRLKSHKDWSGKNCPSTTNFADFKARVKKVLEGGSTNKPTDNKYKNGDYDCNAKVVSPDGVLTVRDKRPENGNLGKKLGEFKTGQVIFVGYCLDNWFGVIYKGKQGFINGTYVDIIKNLLPSTKAPYKTGNYDCKVKVVKTNGTGLNIRADRNPNSSKIGKISEGTVITVDYCKDNWFSTYHLGKLGFISGDYIELI